MVRQGKLIGGVMAYHIKGLDRKAIRKERKKPLPLALMKFTDPWGESMIAGTDKEFKNTLKELDNIWENSICDLKNLDLPTKKLKKLK